MKESIGHKSLKPKIHFVANGIFSTSIAGGDMVYFNLAQAAAEAGYAVNHFGGHAFKQVAAKHALPGTITLTDQKILPKTSGGLTGQLALLRDFYGRHDRTLQLQAVVSPDDIVCATSDYWFDVLPTVKFAARRKLMVLNMEAPTFKEILLGSRPDVDRLRLASCHYWASQKWSLHRFSRCRNRHMIYLHPLMEPRLRKLGIKENESTLISYGIDPEINDAVPAQERIYDVVWIGRPHRQKGIDDLLATLKWVAPQFENFKAVFIGNLREQLLPQVKMAGLENSIVFSGFVTEAEKARLFKASRIFLMPSKHEGSPRVIGESILSRTPVVAYDIPNYRPLFGDLARYAPPFDRNAFKQLARQEISRMRAGENYLGDVDLGKFKRENSWQTARERFMWALGKMS